MAGGRVGSFVRGGETQLRTGGMIVPRSAYVVRHPRGSYIVYPLLSLEATTPQNKLIHWTLSSMYKSASKAVLSRMQLTHHATRPTPHGASRLVQATFASRVGENPACSVPAMQGCEGLRSYDCGHAWHEYTPYIRAVMRFSARAAVSSILVSPAGKRVRKSRAIINRHGQTI